MDYFFACFSQNDSRSIYSSSHSPSSPLSERDGHLPPEPSEGNVEYKFKLVNPSPARLQHLVSQMKWRLREGRGEAIYEIGVFDDGSCKGLDEQEFDASVKTLETMANQLCASVTVLRQGCVGKTSDGGDLRIAEFLIRQIPDSQQFIDLRIAVMGSNESGKSTLLGVLSEGELDNGRGKARLNLLRHLHEIQSGQTSSISLAFVGFDSDGNVLHRREYSEEDMCDKATKVITFIDLAGHEKYMKTTISGLSAYKPDYLLVVVDANEGIANTTRDHLAWCFAIEVPVFLVVTKMDIVTEATAEQTLKSIEDLLKSPAHRRLTLRVKNDDDAFTLASNFQNGSVVPLFTVSNVDGSNIALLFKFLHVLSPGSSQREVDIVLQQPVEFQIDETFCLPHVGHVVCGLLCTGLLREGDHLLLGPNQQGNFKKVEAKSIQRIRTPCRVVQASQSASVCLGDLGEFVLRKGMVLLSASQPPFACKVFQADVCVLFHPGEWVSENFQVSVHIGNVCQTAVIVKVHNDQAAVKAHEEALVTFKFLKQPEYVSMGSRLLFRHGKTKGIGVVRSAQDVGASCS